MEFIGILFSLFFAVVLTSIFSLGLKNTGPWAGFWVFFILLFFISLGVGEWAAPRGPSAWGYYWAPGLIAAIIFGLIIAAASPDSSTSVRRKRSAKHSVTQEEINAANETAVATTVIGAFFWLLIIVLIVIAIGGLLNPTDVDPSTTLN